MRILLDTHIFLWLQTEPERLGRQLPLVEDETNDVCLSAASAWEIAIKVGLGRITLPEPPQTYVPARMQTSGLTPIPVTHAHTLAVSALPHFDDHRDPFDRVLIATARAEGMPIVTDDPQFDRYDVKLLRPGRRTRRPK